MCCEYITTENASVDLWLEQVEVLGQPGEGMGQILIDQKKSVVRKIYNSSKKQSKINLHCQILDCPIHKCSTVKVTAVQ